MRVDLCRRPGVGVWIAQLQGSQCRGCLTAADGLASKARITQQGINRTHQCGFCFALRCFRQVALIPDFSPGNFQSCRIAAESGYKCRVQFLHAGAGVCCDGFACGLLAFHLIHGGCQDSGKTRLCLRREFSLDIRPRKVVARSLHLITLKHRLHHGDMSGRQCLDGFSLQVIRRRSRI